MTTQALPYSESPEFHQATRLHASILAAAEKRLLIRMARRIPAWINPDHLTALGSMAQLMTGLSYAFAGRSRWWLIAGVGLLGMNWLGDSLDGTLARVRNQQRPRYGFYVDHILDSIGAVALMAGLGFSGLMSPMIAAGLLVAFLLLSIQSYLATHTLGEFQMSFWSLGPTELRVLLAAGNVVLFLRPEIAHRHYGLFNIGGAIGIAGMWGMLFFFTGRNIVRLYKLERIS